jgi:protein O-GlcNAc transferase
MQPENLRPELCDQRSVNLSNKNQAQIEALHKQAIQSLSANEPEKAIRLFRTAIKLNPQNAQLMCNLGYALLKQGEYDEALSWFDFALAAQPGWHIANYNRGLALYHLQRFDESKAAFEAGAQAQPDNAQVKVNLAALYMVTYQFERAIEVLGEALQQEPENDSIRITMARAYNIMKRPLKALESLNEIDADKGVDDPAYYIEMAVGFFNTGQQYRATPLLEKAFGLGPLDNPSKLSVAQLYMSLRKSNRSIEFCNEIIAEEPDNYDAYRIKGSALIGAGAVAEAVESSLKCYELAPSYLTNYVSLVFGMNYLDLPRNDKMRAVTRDYEKYANQSLMAVPQYVFNGDRDPNRKLRVGFVSPDLREHSCGYFVESVFAGLDRDQFEIVAVPRKIAKDSRATLLRRLADAWVPTENEIWDDVIANLRSLDLDIAFDLAGHTSNHSLPAFMRRIAPVQINWLGYPNTTGLKNMDYRIIDHHTDPETLDRSIYTEELLRLDRCFLCYSPPSDYPMVEDKSDRDHIVFGSFNSISKVNPSVMQLWVKVLQKVPNSTLVIKALQFGEESLIDRAREQLVKAGVDPDRLQIFGAMPNTFDHLNLYNEIDIGLDPFPYNGTTTTCEAFLMGVPVVTMCGDVHSARVGASLFNALDLDEYVAQSADEYVEIAASLALDQPRLRALQAGMRDRLLCSPLTDRADFSTHFGATLRTKWQEYCKSGIPRGNERHGHTDI